MQLWNAWPPFRFQCIAGKVTTWQASKEKAESPGVASWLRATIPAELAQSMNYGAT